MAEGTSDDLINIFHFTYMSITHIYVFTRSVCIFHAIAYYSYKILSMSALEIKFFHIFFFFFFAHSKRTHLMSMLSITLSSTNTRTWYF